MQSIKRKTPDQADMAIRAQIEQRFDPIGFLGRVMKGEAILPNGKRPTAGQMIKAAEILIKKILPPLKPMALVELDAQPQHEPESKTLEEMLEDMTVEELQALLAEAEELVSVLRRTGKEAEAGENFEKS